MSCSGRQYYELTSEIPDQSLCWLWLVLWLMWFVYRRIEATLDAYKTGTRAASNTTAQWASTAFQYLMSFIYWWQQNAR